MLFAPFDSDLPRRIRTECIPGFFDVVPPQGGFKIPECPGAVNGIEKLFANPPVLHRAREFLHDGPLMNIELGGKFQDAGP